jgi:pimeloyl-ACP methyl ester carboxylesterase
VRARYPDTTGTVERDGVSLGYEVFGEGAITVLLLPTWTIIHTRFWKMQVPYLARRYRVVTYDGPGNGSSERITDPARYSAEAYAADAVAVLDACAVDQAIVVGLSLGCQYGARLAASHPDRVAGLVLVGPALPLVPPVPQRASIGMNFLGSYPDNPQGWEKYNLAYWHEHYEDFASFFFGQVFSEPHSTKPIEDAVHWSASAGPDVLEAEASRPELPTEGTVGSVESHTDARAKWSTVLEALTCPVLVTHGTGDRIQPHQGGMEAARLTGGTLVSMEGSGHMPNVRDPIRFNLILREFIERVPA